MSGGNQVGSIRLDRTEERLRAKSMLERQTECKVVKEANNAASGDSRSDCLNNCRALASLESFSQNAGPNFGAQPTVINKCYEPSVD